MYNLYAFEEFSFDRRLWRHWSRDIRVIREMSPPEKSIKVINFTRFRWRKFGA